LKHFIPKTLPLLIFFSKKLAFFYADSLDDQGSIVYTFDRNKVNRMKARLVFIIFICTPCIFVNGTIVQIQNERLYDKCIGVGNGEIGRPALVTCEGIGSQFFAVRNDYASNSSSDYTNTGLVNYCISLQKGAVTYEKCKYDATQQWKYTAKHIRSVGSPDSCLESSTYVRRSSSTSSAGLIIANCKDVAAQRFKFMIIPD